jgi:hypothetical protein
LPSILAPVSPFDSIDGCSLDPIIKQMIEIIVWSRQGEFGEKMSESPVHKILMALIWKLLNCPEVDI